MYEAWHRLRWPKIEKTTGPVNVIHATTFAIPPRSAPLVVTIHDLAFVHDPSHFTRRGVRFFGTGTRARPERRRPRPVSVDRDDLAIARRTASSAIDLRLVPLGVDLATASDEADRPRAPALRPRAALRDVDRNDRASQEPRPAPRGVRPRGRRTSSSPSSAPRGGTRTSAGCSIGHQNVKALGFVPHEHLAALYAGAELFCFPSLLEGFGFPVLEAMAQGTPVVTSRGTSTEELAGRCIGSRRPPRRRPRSPRASAGR